MTRSPFRVTDHAIERYSQRRRCGLGRARRELLSQMTGARWFRSIGPETALYALPNGIEAVVVGATVVTIVEEWRPKLNVPKRRGRIKW